MEEMEISPLICATNSDGWRGHREVLSVNPLSWKLFTAQMEIPSENSVSFIIHRHPSPVPHERWWKTTADAQVYHVGL